MQKLICSLIVACCLLSCNKVIDEVEVPPFSVFPNPFSEVVSIYFDNTRFPNSDIVVRIRDGKDKTLISIDADTSIGNAAFDMSDYEKGIYYVEMEVGDKTFTAQVLKAD